MARRKGNRMKSQSEILRQASNLLTKASGDMQPINRLRNGAISLDLDRPNARATKIAEIYNRYNSNMRKFNPALDAVYTGRKSGEILDAARNKAIPSSQYMYGGKAIGGQG